MQAKVILKSKIAKSANSTLKKTGTARPMGANLAKKRTKMNNHLQSGFYRFHACVFYLHTYSNQGLASTSRLFEIGSI